MLLSKSKSATWSNKEIQIIQKYKERIRDLEEKNLEKKIVYKDTNMLNFYKITPKEELPKFLQKMKFQTLHSKENVSRAVKIFANEKQSREEKGIRKKLRDEGTIMFLSEIYQTLGESSEQAAQPSEPNSALKYTDVLGSDLEEWEKTKSSALTDKIMVLKKRSPNQGSQRLRCSRIIEEKLSEMQRKNSKGVVNYFKEGSNYRKQIQKQLSIINFTHSNEPNASNKCLLIENSSKLLKKELDDRKLQVEDDIKSKLRILNETRIEHHALFEAKTRLQLEERQFLEELSSKEQFGIASIGNNSSLFGAGKTEKIGEMKAQKKLQVEQNELKILKNKRLIESLENNIQSSEEELRSIMVGEVTYFKSSLKMGMDCREAGLGWILKHLKAIFPDKELLSVNKDNDLEFPEYLDKKSKEFLIVKTHSEDQLEQLLEQKRRFVNEIGQSEQHHQRSNEKKKTNFMSRTLQSNWNSGSNANDRIVEEHSADDMTQLPKKYRRSLRKITMLNQEYAQNQNLLELKDRMKKRGVVEISSNTEGLTGKQLYQTVSERIKYFDFNKTKKDKNTAKNGKLLEYQNLLNSIKEIHIKIEDLDIQHQSHLVSHYKDNKESFFTQAAACFGHKKAYAMIIKHFSWKNQLEI